MSEPIHIISLGAGVQSSTMALMAAAGELSPVPKAAIFADTKAEPIAVMEWLNWLEKRLPFRCYRVTAGSLTAASLRIKTNRKTGGTYYSNLIPAFTLNPDGSKGIVGRHCTNNHKIVPLMKKVRALVGKKALREWRKRHAADWRVFSAAREKKIPCPADVWRRMQADPLVVQWIGISLDEVGRMKPSREPWCLHRWPLIEKEMTRHSCLHWMQKHGFPRPPRSACYYCPFHSDHEWRTLKATDPKAFSKAVSFEKRLQKLHANNNPKGRIVGTPFLHDSLKPLVHFHDVGLADCVFEPTCGDGRMLDAVPAGVPAFGCEIDAGLAQQARERTGREVITGDVLEVEIPHRFNVVFGNPPFRADFLDRMLDRLATEMDDGLRCGLIVPAYFMQTPSRVLRWNRDWTLFAELLPRTLFPRLSKPIIFALFTKDPMPRMNGMRLYLEAAAMEDLKPAYREMMTKGRGLWFVVVDAALAELGGQAELSAIYAAVAVKRPTENPWWREKVRQTLQRRFISRRRGVWARKEAA